MDVHAAEVTRLFATPRPCGASPRPGGILIHASTTRASAALTTAAVQVANLFGARLIAVSCPVHPGGRGALAVERDAQRRLQEAAGEAFAALARPVRAGAVWRSVEGPPHAALADHAWAADLIVLDASGRGAEIDAACIGGVARTSARPLLLMERPCTQGFRTVAVAWDGSPACRRAVQGALPFIARAQEVVLLEGGPGADALLDGLILRGTTVRVRRLACARTSAAAALQLRDAAPDLVVHGLGGAGRVAWLQPRPAHAARACGVSRLVSA